MYHKNANLRLEMGKKLIEKVGWKNWFDLSVSGLKLLEVNGNGN